MGIVLCYAIYLVSDIPLGTGLNCDPIIEFGGKELHIMVVELMIL